VSKYELVREDTIEVFGRTLFRIRSTVAFGDVAEGELGGYVESEGNLVQSGDAWVSGDARVYGDARADLWAILDAAPAEVAALREKVVAGEINGSTYEGACACLCGTIRQRSRRQVHGARRDQVRREPAG
jgi:hypothetical protein